ncbi:MAG: hypothetical protein HY465_02870 [Deltaproteobacteria bacterium]|nr:hypothetical protein [Deltaproteobacteria bacterium]
MKIQKAPFLIILLTATILGTACSGTMSGEIYVDRNHNNLRDAGESSAGRVPVTITRDGKLLISGYASSGKFSVATKGKGIYCANVQTVLLGQSQAPVSGTGTRSLSKTHEGDTSDGGAVEEVGDDEVAGESDEQGGGHSTGGSSSGGQSVGANCCELKWSGSCNIAIAIPQDYTADLDEIPAPPPIHLAAGEHHTLHIAYPCDCELKPLYLPQVLEAVNSGERFDPNLNRVEFVASRPVNARAVSVVGASDICSANVEVAARADIPREDFEYTICPKALCPDGAEQELACMEINVSGEVDLSVEQRPGSSPSAGDLLRVDVVVTNENKVAIDDCQLHVTFPENVEVQSTASSDCSIGSEAVDCECDFASGEEEKTFTIRYRLPDDDEITEQTIFIFNASVEAEDLSGGTAEDEYAFTLSPSS